MRNESGRANFEQEIAQLLSKLEEELRKHNMWSLARPNEEHLASTAPFACDVMPFEHWLQFIFIEKISFMLENRVDLPSSISLTPMAEQVWQLAPDHSLMRLISQIDRSMVKQ